MVVISHFPRGLSSSRFWSAKQWATKANLNVREISSLAASHGQAPRFQMMRHQLALLGAVRSGIQMLSNSCSTANQDVLPPQPHQLPLTSRETGHRVHPKPTGFLLFYQSAEG
jgi:hypothetical protein